MPLVGSMGGALRSAMHLEQWEDMGGVIVETDRKQWFPGLTNDQKIDLCK
jgi:hypothetical protein